jgi:replicative superfamily II helicase
VIISIETPVEDISPEDMLDEKEVEGYYDYLEENEYKSVDDYVLDRYSKTELDNRMYEIYNEFEERKVFFKDLDFIEEEVIQTLLKKAPQWLSATETADILGITSRAIRLNCENGKYESRKAGGVWIINKDSVIESLR